MQAFHNDHKIKDKYLARVKSHHDADEIIKGKYWQNGRGCAVGCTIHGNDHSAYERELGIPRKLAYIEDRIFENLPMELAKTWPERFLNSIRPGADLSKVWPKFAIFLLTDATQCASRHPQCDIVANKLRSELNGLKIEWSAAAAYAYAAADAAAAAAAAYAADAAAYAAAAAYADAAAAAAADAAAASAAAAYAYAYAAAYADAAAAADAAAYAADAAAYAAAYAAASAKERAFIAQSEKLLGLLAEAK